MTFFIFWSFEDIEFAGEPEADVVGLPLAEAAPAEYEICRAVAASRRSAVVDMLRMKEVFRR